MTSGDATRRVFGLEWPAHVTTAERRSLIAGGLGWMLDAMDVMLYSMVLADRQPGQVTRLFRRLHAHGLIAKIPRSRRWRVSLAGRRTMSTAIKLREVAYPTLFATAA